MDKIIFVLLLTGSIFAFSCGTRPDYSAEIKKIDSLQTEVKENLESIEKMDTVLWMSISLKSKENVATLKDVFHPDTLKPEEVSAINYYKGYRQLGGNLVVEKNKLKTEFKKSLKRLEDLKTDTENAALKKEDLDKYLVEENTVTTMLISKFKEMENTARTVLDKYDSINLQIENMIQVYSIKNEAIKIK